MIMKQEVSLSRQTRLRLKQNNRQQQNSQLKRRKGKTSRSSSNSKSSRIRRRAKVKIKGRIITRARTIIRKTQSQNTILMNVIFLYLIQTQGQSRDGMTSMIHQSVQFSQANFKANSEGLVKMLMSLFTGRRKYVRI